MTHLSNSTLKSWIPYSADCDFSIQNIPFGVYRTATGANHLASAIGKYIIDLAALNSLGYFSELKIAQEILK